MIKKIISVCLALIFGVTLASCGNAQTVSGDGYAAEVIKINCATTYSHVLTFIIREKDMLSQYLPDGVTVEWTGVTSSEGLRDGMSSGDIDISAMSGTTVVTAIEQGIPILILSGHVIVSAGVYSKDPNILGIEDLLNVSEISVNSIGSVQSLMMMAMSKDEFNDINILRDKFVAMEAAVGLTAFTETDDIECLAAVFPNSARAAAAPGAHEVVDLTPYAKKYELGNYFVVNENFYNNNPVLIEAFRNAQQDALAYMVENPEDTGKLLGEMWNIDVETMIEEVKTSVPNLEVNSYDESANLLYEAGILDAPPKKLADMPNYADIPKAE